MRTHQVFPFPQALLTHLNFSLFWRSGEEIFCLYLALCELLRLQQLWESFSLTIPTPAVLGQHHLFAAAWSIYLTGSQVLIDSDDLAIQVPQFNEHPG